MNHIDGIVKVADTQAALLSDAFRWIHEWRKFDILWLEKCPHKTT